MAAGNVNANRGPGVLIKDPTSVTVPGASGNYGGTFLGLSRDHELLMLDKGIVVPGEELGGAPTEELEGGKWCIFGALMRGWDDDALATIYANTATGSSSGKKVVRLGGSQSVKPGHRKSDRAVKLLFLPNDTTKRAVLIYKALPGIREDSRIALSIFRESTHAVSFIGIPDATGRVAEVGRLADLTL